MLIALAMFPSLLMSQNKIQSVHLEMGDEFFTNPYTADSLVVTGEYIENDLIYYMLCYSDKEKPSLQVKYLDISKSVILNENYNEDEFVIDNYALKNCRILEHVILPTNTTTLGSHLFLNCSHLHTVVLPDSLKEIRPMAFVDCPTLRNFSISSANRFYSTQNNTLYDKEKSKLLFVPSTISGEYDLLPHVTHVAYAAFYNCDKITGVRTNGILKHIDDFSFYGCKRLSNIEIPSSVEKIGKFAFFKCASLKTVVLPKNIKEVGTFAFSGCESLESVRVETEQFSNECLFAGCTKLASFTTNEDNRLFSSKDGVLFDKEGKVLIAYPNAKESDYEVPASVEKIGKCSFFDCENLKNIILPSHLIEIERAAFSNCHHLESIKLFAANPPHAIESSFAMVDKHKCVLYVPNNSLSLYKKHPIWGAFDNIVGF